MPVHAPGPRLYSSIPFRHLAQVKGGGGRAVNVALNVTPFVDMMTILVTFLLMVFSTSGELISAQRGLTLPDATNKDKLKAAPIIVVSQDRITFQGEDMGDVRQLADETSMEWKIIELYDRLRQEKVAFLQPGGGFEKLSDQEKSYCTNPQPDPPPDQLCLDGLVILQADKDTPAKVLNRVIKTAYAAEYPNIMFAVNRRAARAQ